MVRPANTTFVSTQFTTITKLCGKKNNKVNEASPCCSLVEVNDKKKQKKRRRKPTKRHHAFFLTTETPGIWLQSDKQLPSQLCIPETRFFFSFSNKFCSLAHDFFFFSVRTECFACRYLHSSSSCHTGSLLSFSFFFLSSPYLFIAPFAVKRRPFFEGLPRKKRSFCGCDDCSVGYY